MSEKLITTGYSLLDVEVGNFIHPNLILVTHGNKKEFLTDITTFVSVSEKIPTAIFSLEFQKEDVIQNLLSCATKISIKKEDIANFDSKEWHNLSKAMGSLTAAPIVISDDAFFIEDIENLIKKFCNEYNNSKMLIIIDNLQLLETKEPSVHEEKLKNIIERLTLLANETKTTIILLTNHSYKDTLFLSEIATLVCL